MEISQICLQFWIIPFISARVSETNSRTEFVTFFGSTANETEVFLEKNHY